MTLEPLDDAQADGMACVLCGTSFVTATAPAHVPVGYSRTGSQVFACAPGCAVQATR